MTHDACHYIDLVEGHQLNLTNPDGARTLVGIYLHENRLYILDETVPANSSGAGALHAVLGFRDAEGRPVRYHQIYSNHLPPVTMQRPGGNGRGQGPGPAR